MKLKVLSGGRSAPAEGRASVRRFLERSLPGPRRQHLDARYPDVMARIMSGQIDDAAIADRILEGDEALTWVLHIVLHTTFFVRTLTWRCRSFCGSPCNPSSLEELPCGWAERVLWDFFERLTPLSPSRPLLEDFLRYAPADQGLVDWLGYKLHYNYHYRALQEAGFIPPEPSRMPRAIQALAQRDPAYRILWVHRWYWGNSRLDTVAPVVGMRADDPALLAMVDEVDRAFLTSREVKSLTAKYQALRQTRQDSGIPPRFPR